jgi:hypothetical protein
LPPERQKKQPSITKSKAFHDSVKSWNADDVALDIRKTARLRRSLSTLGRRKPLKKPPGEADMKRTLDDYEKKVVSS